MKNNTIEKKTAATVLQKGQQVVVGGRRYIAAPPSAATLIEVSGLVSLMPPLDVNANDLLTETLRAARDCRVVGDIVATLLLGAEPPRSGVCGWLRSLLYGLRRRRMAQALLHKTTPAELSKLTARLLKGLQVDFFFGIISFLREVNLLRPTAQSKTTASGL